MEIHKNEKLNFIDPILKHSVYNWWAIFFNKYFLFHIFSLENNEKNKNNSFTKLATSKLRLSLKSNTFLFFKDPKTNKDNINIIWDIFMNNLSFKPKYLNSKTTAFYSEYYSEWKSKLKNLLFYIIWYLFFKNKKIIVPHKLWEKTFRKISKNVFYLPQLYCGDIVDSPIKRQDSNIKFLFVWRISQYYKNVEFMIKNFLNLKQKNCELLLAWKIYDIDDKYRSLLQESEGNVKYLWEKSFSDLEKLYQSCDFLILPSKSEPIGAVVQEAMANGCIPIVSDLVWSSGYLDNQINWFVFKSNDDNNFLRILNDCSKLSSDEIHKLKVNCITKVKTNYDCKKGDSMEKLYHEFIKFMI